MKTGVSRLRASWQCERSPNGEQEWKHRIFPALSQKITIEE